MPPALAWEPPPLQPFTATYQAFYKGKEAGDASMQVTHTGGNQWRVDRWSAAAASPACWA